MSRHVLRSAICLALIWPTSFVAGAESFAVTERFKAEFVVEDANSPAFVVTDRASPLPAMTDTAGGSTTTPRPIVRVYSAKWCVPCRIARQELERASLPFELQVVDVTLGGQPGYVDEIPYFEWQTPRGRWFAKWTSVADLVKRWELTR